MTYFMTYSESMKAICPSDNLRLRMPTKQGTNIEVHIYQAVFRGSTSSLVAVPANPGNLAALGLDADHDEPRPWIIPPFSLLGRAFSKGGPFIPDGKLSRVPIDLAKTAVLDGHEVFRPDRGCFIPQHQADILPWEAVYRPVDRSEWTIEIWVETVVKRPATDEERNYLLVPWADFGPGYLDLWLEQYRCCHQGLPIPTELREPGDGHDCSDTTVETTGTGLPGHHHRPE